MGNLSSSELVLNQDQSVYHLQLHPEDLADLVILVGDPDRVAMVSKHFTQLEVKKQHREFVTHTGYIDTQRISVISTGIGVGNIDIVLNELDALANIDLATRTLKSDFKKLDLIRIGTTGGLSSKLDIGDFALTSFALGFDNLRDFYVYKLNSTEKELTSAINHHFSKHPIQPYVAQGSLELIELLNKQAYTGLTATCPGFYGPQGRSLRLEASMPNILDDLASFSFAEHTVLNFEMETSAIYSLANLLGHNCCSLSVVIANRVKNTFCEDLSTAVENLITYAVDSLLAPIRK